MSLPARVATLVIAFLAVVAGGIYVAFNYIGAQPPTVDYTSVASNGQVNVTLMTTAQSTVGDKPDWVTYFIQDPQTKQFVHTTYFSVPAATRINVTILGYDGCTPLRNPVWGKVAGTAGNVENVSFFNGKTLPAATALLAVRHVGKLLGAAHVRDPGPRAERADRIGDDVQRRTATCAALPRASAADGPRTRRTPWSRSAS